MTFQRSPDVYVVEVRQPGGKQADRENIKFQCGARPNKLYTSTAAENEGATKLLKQLRGTSDLSTIRCGK